MITDSGLRKQVFIKLKRKKKKRKDIVKLFIEPVEKPRLVFQSSVQEQ